MGEEATVKVLHRQDGKVWLMLATRPTRRSPPTTFRSSARSSASRASSGTRPGRPRGQALRRFGAEVFLAVFFTAVFFAVAAVPAPRPALTNGPRNLAVCGPRPSTRAGEAGRPRKVAQSQPGAARYWAVGTAHVGLCPAHCAVGSRGGAQLPGACGTAEDGRHFRRRCRFSGRVVP